MEKVALVYIGNIEICPYIKAYEKILTDNKCDYDVIFWERENLKKSYPKNYRYFRYLSDPAKSKKNKIWDFVKYFLWLKKALAMNYSCIVFLDTLSAVLAYFGNIGKTRFGIEVRDYSYEGLMIFKYIEKKIFSKANKIFISSGAFRSFLPSEYNYIQTHNLNLAESKLERQNENKIIKKDKEKYKIVYVGSLKYFDCQKSIVDELSNDERFIIEFHGYGPEYNRFVKYCEEKQIKNITITGLYTDDMKPEFYADADFIINCYDKKEGSEVLYALSNKYYDGLIYHIPQIVEKGTYKGKIITDSHLGIEWDIDTDRNLSNKIIEFVENIDTIEFNATCHKILNLSLKEYNNYLNEIQDLVMGK